MLARRLAPPCATTAACSLPCPVATPQCKQRLTHSRLPPCPPSACSFLLPRYYRTPSSEWRFCFCQALYPTIDAYAQCRPGSHPRHTTALADPSSTLASCVVLAHRRACPMGCLSYPCLCSFDRAVPSLQALSLLPLWSQTCSPCIVGLCVAHAVSTPRPAAGYDSTRHSLRCVLLKTLDLLRHCRQSDTTCRPVSARTPVQLAALAWPVRALPASSPSLSALRLKAELAPREPRMLAGHTTSSGRRRCVDGLATCQITPIVLGVNVVLDFSMKISSCSLFRGLLLLRLKELVSF